MDFAYHARQVYDNTEHRTQEIRQYRQQLDAIQQAKKHGESNHTIVQVTKHRLIAIVQLLVK